MPIEKVLIEFAKLQLQLISANERIAALEAENAALKSVPKTPAPDQN
jgi:hypothetical protein